MRWFLSYWHVTLISQLVIFLCLWKNRDLKVFGEIKWWRVCNWRTEIYLAVSQSEIYSFCCLLSTFFQRKVLRVHPNWERQEGGNELVMGNSTWIFHNICGTVFKNWYKYCHTSKTSVENNPWVFRRLWIRTWKYFLWTYHWAAVFSSFIQCHSVSCTHLCFIKFSGTCGSTHVPENVLLPNQFHLG